MLRLCFFLAAILVSISACHPVFAGDTLIHGFVSQGYLKTNHNNYIANTNDGSFQFNEIGINFLTFPTSDLKIGCQLFARDFGPFGNDKVAMNWAFAEYTYKNWLGVRAGLIKVPFGFYKDLRDFDSLRAWILLPSGVYNEWLRDSTNNIKGLELFGAVTMGSLGIIEYQAMCGDSDIPIDGGMAYFITTINQSIGIQNLTELDIGRSFVAKFVYTPTIDGLRFSYTYARMNDFIWEGTYSSTSTPIRYSADYFIYQCISAEYIWKKMILTGEHYFHIKKADVYIGHPAIIINKDSRSNSSYYLSIGYRFTRWLETSYYFSYFIFEPENHGEANKLKENCLSLRFDINPFWLLKLETHLMDGKFGVEPGNDGKIHSDWLLYAAKLTFSF